MIKKISIICAVPILFLSGCSSDEEPDKTVKGTAHENTFQEEAIKDSDESIQSEPREEIGMGDKEEIVFEVTNDGTVKDYEVETAANVPVTLVHDLIGRTYFSAQSLNQTGYTAEEIIAGKGDEETLQTLKSQFPTQYMGDDGASLQEQLAAYAYLVKVSSLFKKGGPPCPEPCDPNSFQDANMKQIFFRYLTNSASVKDGKVLVPGYGAGIGPSEYDIDFVEGISYVIQTPFSVYKAQEGSKETGYAKWVVSTKDLAKHAKETGGVIDYKQLEEILLSEGPHV